MKRIVSLILFIATIVLANIKVDQSEVLYYNGGAAESSTGTASVAFFDNPMASLHNPAGLAVTEKVKFSLLSGDIFGNYGYVLASSAIPTWRGILGISGRYWNSYSRATVPEAFGGGISWAKRFTDTLNFGIAFKIHEIYYRKDNIKKYPQFGIDAGGLYIKKFEKGKNDTYISDWSVGASVLNIGNFFVRDAHTNFVGFPFQIRLGTALGIEFLSWYKAKANMDFVLANFISPRLNLGLENIFDDKFILNTGYLFGNKLNYVSFGLGYKFLIKTMEGKATASFLPQKDGKFSLSLGIDLAFGEVDKTPPKIEFNLSKKKNSDPKTLDSPLIILETMDGSDIPKDGFYFSPNFDGIKDILTIKLSIKDNKALESWKIEIKDDNNKTVRTWTSPDIRTLKGKLTFMKIMTRMFEKEKTVPVPTSIEWNGTDDKGNLLPDGIYTVSITATDIYDNTSSISKRIIVLDTTPPKAEIKSDLTLFSPDGDGSKDFLTIYQNTEGEDSWEGVIINDRNEIIKKWTWEDKKPDSQIIWDGKDNNNRLAPNGVYSYILKGTDKAGNSVERRLSNLTLSTDKQTASVDADLEFFSPNNDGNFDTITFSPNLTSEAGLENWTLVILNEDGKEVRSFNGTTKLEKIIKWNGTDKDSRILPDGNYYYRLKTVFQNGSRPESFTKAITIDNTPPKAELNLNSEIFAPDGTGKNEKLVLNITTSDVSGIQNWKVIIKDEQNKIVKSFEGKGAFSGPISWEGIKDDGNKVKGGEIYSVILEATDIVNNKKITDPLTFRIDSTPPDIRMEVKNKIFSPDGDGEAETQVFSFSKFDSKTLAEWTLELFLIDREKKTEKSVKKWTGTILPTEIVWDGIKEDGTLVKGGEIYKAVFVANDVLYNSTTLKAQFAVDSTPPLVQMRFTPQIFSPDGDGENDILNISFVRRDKKKIVNWSLEIRPVLENGLGSVFKKFSGELLPAETLTWNGLSDKDELVESAQDYLMSFSCSDLLGNITTQTSILPVDILVIPTPYGLMIKISTIRFEYNSAELKDERSLKILDKVSKILLRYRTYKVQIDGHTDNIGSAAYNLDLSTRRAQTVMNFLIKKGVPQENLRARGLGFSRPTADNSTEEGRAKNRRVEFLLYKSGEWPVESQTPSTENSP